MVCTTRSFWASDVVGQKRQHIRAPAEVRVGDFTAPLLEQLRLPTRDASGNALTSTLTLSKAVPQELVTETV